MATGRQGPQGFKGARGVQGATGWGAIGNSTGPTGPTGPIGWFQYQDTQNAEGTLTFSASTVSTLYKITTGSQGEIRLNLDATLPVGGFHVLTNQSSDSFTLTATGYTGGKIDGQDSLTVPIAKSVMLIRGPTGTELRSSYPYSQGGSTGTLEGGF